MVRKMIEIWFKDGSIWRVDFEKILLEGHRVTVQRCVKETNDYYDEGVLIHYHFYVDEIEKYIVNFVEV